MNYRMLSLIAIGFAVAAVVCGCASYEKLEIDWEKNANEHHKPLGSIELTLGDVRRRVIAFSPRLNRLRLEETSATNIAANSGWWEDPTLDADILRILRTPEEPIIAGISPRMTIPLSGIPGLEKKANAAYGKAARQAIIQAEIDEASAAEISAANVIEYSKTIGEIKALLESPQYTRAMDQASKLSKSGEIPPSVIHSLLFERRQLENEMSEMLHEKLGNETKLRREMRLRPDCRLILKEYSGYQVTTQRFECIELVAMPGVKAILARLEAGEAEMEKEIRRQYPDLTIGPEYSREEGYNRIGVGVSLPLPLWNRNRLAIAEADGKRKELREEAISLWRDYVFEWQGLVYESTRLHEEIASLPIAENSVEEANALFVAGEIGVDEYLGSVHRRINDEIVNMKKRLDYTTMCIRMNRFAESMKKGRDE